MRTLLRRLWSGQVDWTVSLFVMLSPLAAIISMWVVMAHGGGLWPTWVLAVALMPITSFGISAGYHRLFSHVSYKASWIVRLTLLLLGAANLAGSAHDWCSNHRNHHRHVDRDEDPYNATRGFWYSHILWMMYHDHKHDYSNVADLMKDPLIRWQHKWYQPISIITAFVVPGLIAALWGDFWGGLLIAGLVRVVVNHHCSMFVNSYCHYFGTQPYSDQNTARDSCLEKLRLVRHLRRVRPEHILAARLHMEEKRLRARVARKEPLTQEWELLLAKARANVTHLQERFLGLRAEYAELKRDTLHNMQSRLKEVRAELKFHRRALRCVLKQWSCLIRGASLSEGV